MGKRAVFVGLHQAIRLGAVLAGMLAAASPGAGRAQQFSADIVMQQGMAALAPGRLRVLDGKARIEVPEFADGFFLIDTATPSAYFVRPGLRIYMDARRSSQLTRLLVSVDTDGPCRNWQAMARLAGSAEQGNWRCERVGEELIDGRAADVFRVLSGSGQLFGWIDRDRKFPLRIKTEDGTVIALAHIRDEPQSASSFAVPPNFRKFSPETLIERIERSDVLITGEKDKARP